VDGTKESIREVAEAVRGEGRSTAPCPACGTSNDADAKFCDACGTQL